jgi:DNA-binding CsgD family transcriptional regulator
VQLRVALNFAAGSGLLAGELSTVARMVEEDRVIAEAVGNVPIAYPEMLLAAWRGREAQACALIEPPFKRPRRAASAGSSPPQPVRARCSPTASAAMTPRDAARRAFEDDQLGQALVMPELVEGAAKTGDVELLTIALEWLSERTRVTRSDWALGIEARIRALLSEGDAADRLYRASIAHRGGTRVRVELARGHLMCGEWLRRERRRVDARGELRTAHEMLCTMGLEAFAERARRELSATGATARKRVIETRDGLTDQEAQVARRARDGLSNAEIATRLFISPHTVAYHLRKVFAKLDITSRNQLHGALPGD